MKKFMNQLPKKPYPKNLIRKLRISNSIYFVITVGHFLQEIVSILICVGKLNGDGLEFMQVLNLTKNVLKNGTSSSLKEVTLA